MASIGKDKGGLKRILFVAPDGKRKTVRLGKVSKRAAETVKIRIEQLLAAKLTGHAIEAGTAGWLNECDSSLLDKLARVGLIPKPEKAATTTLATFLNEIIDGRTDVKPATKLVWGHVRRNLVEFFGENRDVRTVTPGDADEFKLHLIGELAPTTVHKRLQFARTFFRAMLRRKIIPENPFADVKSPASGVQDKQRFISRAEIEQVLEACPSQDWRTIVALARYGGLRCPSEVLSVRWQDIDWDAGRLVVTSPKTEHHVGKESRTIPLFPELREVLTEAFEAAPEGAKFVVDEKYRRSAMGPNGWGNTNLRTTFTKIVKRAGLTLWSRLFHNLRASRETELAESFPIQVVASWLGNTPRVALKHYLMVTAEHFQAALGPDNNDAAQNAAQSRHAGSRNKQQTEPVKNAKTPVIPGSARDCDYSQSQQVEVRGLEPLTSSLQS